MPEARLRRKASWLRVLQPLRQLLQQLLLRQLRLRHRKRQHRFQPLLKSRSVASSCRRPARVLRTRRRPRLRMYRLVVPSSSVLVVLELARVAHVRLMVAPAVLVALLVDVPCIRRVHSPVDLRPAPADALALASVLVSVDLVPDSVDLAPEVAA